MIKITLAEYLNLPNDCRGIWTTERYDQPNWAEVRTLYIGKRTMLHNDNGVTTLLIEGLSFEIIEGDFYARAFTDTGR